ncbi:MAG: DUF3159 domain-containing protein [Candidatus Aenigmarchaeota archaeon]|nr:DUF3159 domain-containing protein [Candidatus Aenigmarchaeota archaeon]
MVIMGSRSKEILEQLNEVLIKRRNTLEIILPSIVFLIVNITLGFSYAVLVSMMSSFLFTIYKLLKGNSIKYSVLGFFGALFSVLVTRFLGRLEGYFLPGIAINFLIIVLSVLSLILRKPLVSWASHLSRGWSLNWYWHEKVRPAYTEVTLFWVLILSIKLVIQIFFFRLGNPDLFGTVNVITGWPLTVFILILSYVYGSWRLKNLNGPSVQEFEKGKKPPWKGQNKGF